MDLNRMHEQLRALTDRAAVERLVTRYLRSLDEGPFDTAWARTFFTEDAWSETPVGVYEGIDAQLSSTGAAMALFERTVHFGTDLDVEQAGDRATLRWNQLSTHVLKDDGAESGERLFVSGGHCEAEAVRAAGGDWRFRRLALRVAWTQGRPPVLPA
ncbi:nuclear transport factor 2 family protein [Streptomyces roseoverticillatus]|uniref:Nuclear transport factor 2 family protein n=1 Tax=Streptomyces roseoverticillatus TaxID=66429 RepID=A0ABV3IZA4_9ACTN